MLFKIVLDKQIRIFDCKETLTLEALTSYVKKSFPHLGPFSFYYVDEDGDHIILETKEDISVYLEIGQKKPKIFVKQIQAEREVFDSASHLVQQVSTEKIKVQKKDEEVNPLPKIEEKSFEEEVKKQEKMPQVKKENTQKQSIMVHQVKCNYCGIFPIPGIRFKCAICPNFDLCLTCHDKKVHGIEHPFAKIRDSNSAPLLVQVELEMAGKKIREREKQEKLSQLIQNKVENKEVELKFDSPQEKQLIITSFLESLFGPQNEQYYKQFARLTVEKTEERVCQSFLKWMAMKKQNPDFNLLTWFKETFQKASAKIGNTISFYSD